MPDRYNFQASPLRTCLGLFFILLYAGSIYIDMLVLHTFIFQSFVLLYAVIHTLI